jgi:hypothetical protein
MGSIIFSEPKVLEKSDDAQWHGYLGHLENEQALGYLVI